MGIRNSAKAVIVHDGKILLNKCCDKNNGDYYALPGGGQQPYETLHEAVMRECLEETGYTVTPLRLAAVHEGIITDERFREKHPEYAHKLFLIFACALASEKAVTPTEKDSTQLDSEWVEISALLNIKILPLAVGENIMRIIHTAEPVFLPSKHIEYEQG
jgi:ADP-ribose pyrophosphatase YjhB (NUDIX family)